MSRFVHLCGDRLLRSYAPSFFQDGWLDATQRHLVDSLNDVRGKLEPADHFKLYEAGYFARGPILEIGRLAAKSTICLALGARAAGHGHPIYSIEYAHRLVEMAQDNLRRSDVLDDVTLIQGDSAVQIGRVPAPLDTVFVDGNHSYEGVRRDIEALDGRIARGGVVMIHDYFHPANETSEEYGVRQAVDEAAPSARWSFRGQFGGIALFEQE